MKKIKQLMLSFSIIGMVLILSIGGCKKELSSDSAKLKNADLLMSKEAGPGKKKVLRQSPGLKIEVKGETIKRISPTLKNIDKITSILNEEQSKKNQGRVMTTKSVSFTASLAGTYYNCYAELNDPGPYDWYLINWNTGVYTYIGSSTDYINFNVQKPSMYGSYRVWGEGPYGAGFTGYQYLGDPYVGVSKVGGILSFTNQAAYDALVTRLEDAYETHQTYIDQFDNLSDDATDAALLSAGFNQFLPYEEFEAYFGLSSLRAQIQGEVDYWFGQNQTDMSGFPEDNYFPYSLEEQTLMTSEGQIEIAGVGEGPFTLPTTMGLGWQDPQNPGSNTCMFQAKKNGHENYQGGERNVRKKVLVSKWDSGATKFVGNSQTFRKNFLGFFRPAVQRQRTKVYGSWYDPSCVYQGEFDSGLSNPGNNKRYSQRVVEKKNVDNLASKEGEWSMAVTISTANTTFTQTYSH